MVIFCDFRCCKKYNFCFKRVNIRNDEFFCFFNKIKYCEIELIDCIEGVKVDFFKEYKNYDRNKCK